MRPDVALARNVAFAPPAERHLVATFKATLLEHFAANRHVDTDVFDLDDLSAADLEPVLGRASASTITRWCHRSTTPVKALQRLLRRDDVTLSFDDQMALVSGRHAKRARACLLASSKLHTAAKARLLTRASDKGVREDAMVTVLRAPGLNAAERVEHFTNLFANEWHIPSELYTVVFDYPETVDVLLTNGSASALQLVAAADLDVDQLDAAVDSCVAANKNPSVSRWLHETAVAELLDQPAMNSVQRRTLWKMLTASTKQRLHGAGVSDEQTVFTPGCRAAEITDPHTVFALATRSTVTHHARKWRQLHLLASPAITLVSARAALESHHLYNATTALYGPLETAAETLGIEPDDIHPDAAKSGRVARSRHLSAVARQDGLKSCTETTAPAPTFSLSKATTDEARACTLSALPNFGYRGADALGVVFTEEFGDGSETASRTAYETMFTLLATTEQLDMTVADLCSKVRRLV